MYFVCVRICKGHEPFLLFFKAVCSRQDPTGVDKDSSTPVKVLSATGLVNINGRLPWLVSDVAIFAPIYAECRAIQGVICTLTTCCYREDRLQYDG